MLAGDATVEAVTFGDDGIIASLPSSATHVSCSTISVALSERLTAAHASQSAIAAPVFGPPKRHGCRAFRCRGRRTSGSA
jgi:3-hydroxyisobutyrate dehydrogenase-like beta-hydroxyacid dehydrogenase